MTPLRLAVFDADAPPALAFIRSAGRLGVPVDVYSHEERPPARFSRYARRFSRCPPTSDLGSFVPWLEARVLSGEIVCVAPTSDMVAFAIGEVRHLLDERVRRALPTKERMWSVLFKDRMPVVEDSRLRVPTSFFPSSIEEALDEAPRYPYPLVAKPRSHVALPLERGAVVRDAVALRRLFSTLVEDERSRVMAKRFPGVDMPLLQTLLEVERLVSVSGLIVDGRVRAVSAAKKSLTWPPPLGVGLIFEPVIDEPFLADAIRYVEDALGEGLFELELVVDPRDPVPRVLDVNPRAFGQIALDVARGLDLPGLWLRRVRGEDIADVRATRHVAGWQHSVPLIVSHLVALVGGDERRVALAALRRDLSQARVDATFDARDPLPGTAFVASMLQHPGGLVRPFWRARRRRGT